LVRCQGFPFLFFFMQCHNYLSLGGNADHIGGQNLKNATQTF
jgi:hypothetical protein